MSFSYSGDGGEHGEKYAVKDLDFTIRKGETIGIIGGTGPEIDAGQLDSAVFDVTEGSVSVEGINVKEYPFSQLREKVGMVPQLAELFSGTIASNLRWGNAHAPNRSWKTPCESHKRKISLTVCRLGWRAQ